MAAMQPLISSEAESENDTLADHSIIGRPGILSKNDPRTIIKKGTPP
jgi:hypothetical protein